MFRRAVVYAAAVTALLAGGVTGLPGGSAEPRPSHLGAKATWRQIECRFNSLYAPAWTAKEERLTSECVLAKWGVSGGYRKFWAVGACESDWNRMAYNGGGPSYLGLFQHSAAYWGARVRNLEPARWTLAPHWSNSRTQIVVTARMVHAGGWGPWSCAN